MDNSEDTSNQTLLPDTTVAPGEVVGGLMPQKVERGPLADLTPFSTQEEQQPVNDPGAAFGALTEPDKALSANRYSDSQTQLTATLGGLAQLRTGMDTGTADGRLNALVGLNQQVLVAGQEKLLRAQIAQQARINQINAINNAQATVLKTGGEPAFAGATLKDLMSYGLDVHNQPLDHDELEMQGVAHLQSMAAEDPDQAAILQNFQKNGDVLDRVRDNVIKMQLFNREMDALKQAKKSQGWGADAADVLGGLLIPSLFRKTGNVAGAKTGFFDLPSTQQNKEVASLWDLPLDEFRGKLPDVFQKFGSLNFGLTKNNTEALNTAEQFAYGGLNNSDALTFNLFTGLDVAAFLPLERMLAVPSKTARVLGNRTASADISASAIASEIHGVPNGLDGLQAPYHSIEESMPSSLVPDTLSFVRPDVGVPGDIADRLSAIAKGTKVARQAITTQDRLAPAQLADAIEAATKRAQLEFRDDPIADMKYETVRSTAGIPQRDIDNVTAIGSDGSYKTNALRIADEHDAEVTDILTAAHANAVDAPSGKAADAADKRARYNAPDGIEAPANSNVADTSVTSLNAPSATPDAVNLKVYPNEVGGIRGDIAVSRNPDTGIYSLNFYLGKRYSSGGFMTQQAAEKAAVRRGFGLQDVGIHQNSDGQWFVKVKQAVTENGVTSPVLRQADFPNLGLFPRMSAAIKSADNILPEMFNRARITQTVGKQKFLASVVGPYVKLIKQAGPKGARSISKVMQVGEREQKWFTFNEFEQQFERVAGRTPTKKEALAYYAAKELSDLNYHIFNSNLYAEKARRGIVTVSAKNEAFGLDTGRINGRVVNEPDFTGRFFDFDENATVHGDPGGDLARKFSSGHYRVIDLERPYERPGEDPIKQIIVHNASSTVGPLEAEQLGYVAGGSRENRFKWFVKQAQSGTFKDGTQYWKQPHTHIAARTGKQARDWAESMEAARKAFFDTAMSDAEKRRIIELSPAETYEKFAQLVDGGTISKDHPFEALFDRQTPTAMNHLGDDAVKFINSDETPEETYAISKGRMYYSGKGDRLPDPHGDYAEIMDPFTTLHKATQNAAQTFAFSDYNKKVVDEWARTAAPFMDRRSVGNNWDSYNLFFNGKLSDDFFRANPTFANQLELSRNTHKRLLGSQSPEQRMSYHAARRFADWVENKGAWGERLAGRVLDRSSGDPVTALRGMVFDAKLGFFDPGQLIVQTQTALAAMTIDPANGARTAAQLLPLGLVLTNHSEPLLARTARAMAPLAGLTTEDWTSMVRSLRNSGWMNVGGEVMQLDQYINTIGGSAFNRSFNQIRELGRTPFNMSEKFNRMTAYSMAWKAMRDKYPKLAGESREFQSFVNKYADDLSMNMTSSSAAFWQKGVLSVPTQFLAYQTRVLENLLPETFGGSARFTGAQKTRLALGQLFLYGSAGLPLGNEMMEWANKSYQNATGEQLTPETWRVLTKGFWDTALFYGSDGKLDTDFAQRAGQGGAWTDFFRKLTDGSMNSVLQVATGPVGGVTDKFVDSIMKVSRYMQAEQFGQLSTQDFTMIAKDLTSEISSVSRAQKSYWIWKTGTVKDKTSGEAIVQVEQLNAVAAALGIPTRQETEFWERTRDLKDRDAIVRDWGKLIAGTRRNAFDAMTAGDDEKEAHYEKLATGLLMAYQDDPMLMEEIAKETEKQLGYSDTEWNNLVQRLYERTGKPPVGGQ